ncbi:MAG: hypothetical protein LBU92_05920, partial [Prevotellaceae bacterium]|nr:hypothetical protein [Prevotellaceae bacterium]
MPYNPNIHHRRSIRLKGYDYAQAGLYFLTICVHGGTNGIRPHIFGKVVSGKMVLNEYGKIALNEWIKTPNVRPNIQLGEFVIMPNHMHGIIIITDTTTRRGVLHTPMNTAGVLHTPVNTIGVSHTPVNTAGELQTSNSGECNSPLRGTSNTVGAIVRGYKSAVTKQLCQSGFADSV